MDLRSLPPPSACRSSSSCKYVSSEKLLAVSSRSVGAASNVQEEDVHARATYRQHVLGVPVQLDLLLLQIGQAHLDPLEKLLPDRIPLGDAERNIPLP